MEVESTLTRLREAIAEINRATETAQNWAVLEKTWLLQDRLVFPQRVESQLMHDLPKACRLG
jgi:hypothetical protein